MRSKLDTVLILINVLASYLNIVLLTVLQIDPGRLNGLNAAGQESLFDVQVVQLIVIIGCVIYLSFFYKLDDDFIVVVRIGSVGMVILTIFFVLAIVFNPTMLNPSPYSPDTTHDDWCCVSW